MFNSLKQGLSNALGRLSGRHILSETDVAEALKLVRTALLEADVALEVAKLFIEKIQKQAVGEAVIKSVRPADMVIKIVNDELINLLKSENQELDLRGQSPVVIMMVGPQGFGKTTSAIKLARFVKEKLKKNVMVASLDTYRPAAQQQLEILAQTIGVNSVEIISQEQPVQIAKRALKKAASTTTEVLILDTAGRLHTDEMMMQELRQIKEISRPKEVLLVADAMLGQDAALVARSFNEALDITGVIMSRVDGDARGGAALSMRTIASKPIKFIGTGEKPEDFEIFHPDRIASSILGFGDVVGLVEKAQEVMDEQEAQKTMERIQKGLFDFNDMYKQLKSLNRLGGIGKVASMMPGLGGIMSKMNVDAVGAEVKRQIIIIQSMSKMERKVPSIINPSRINRIAKGAGVSVADVRKLIKKYEHFGKMMKQFSRLSPSDIEKMQRMMNVRK
jgi:signal recognition particle subunit SRP54